MVCTPTRPRVMILGEGEAFLRLAALLESHPALAAWEAVGRPAFDRRPGEGEVVARAPGGREIVRYASALPVEGFEGEIESLSLWSGQSVGVIHDVLPAAEIVRRLAAECNAALEIAAG